MEAKEFKFSTFFWRITSSHMITYFILGIIAVNLLNYQEIFDNSDSLRAFDSPWISAGAALQVIRGLIISIALWYFKDCFLYQKYGWLKLWGLIAGLSILSTAGATPGSIEGFIYTTIPVVDQIKGYIEIIPQTLLFAILVFYWYERPKKVWNILSVVFVSLITLMSLMGVLSSMGIIGN